MRALYDCEQEESTENESHIPKSPTKMGSNLESFIYVVVMFPMRGNPRFLHFWGVISYNPQFYGEKKTAFPFFHFVVGVSR